jgi:FkbM family methyltransferase
LILGIDPRAREGFEHFCFRSLEMAEELDAFRSLASQRNRFVDIGAYFGIFTLVFLRDRPAGRAVAVEPSPLARKILRANLSANGMEHATVVDVALGARTASLVARLNEYHLEATEAPEVSGEDATVQVPTRSLDDLCDELGVAPDLLKVDVEGFEIEVLEGARRTLASHQPALMLELHPYLLRRQGRTASEVTSLLEDLGYRPRSLRGRALEWTEVAAVEEVSRIVCHPAPPDRDGG